MRLKKTFSGILLGSTLAMVTATSGAAVVLFGTLGGPEFEIDYAAAGVATVGANYTGPFGIQTPDVVGTSVAGLSFISSVSGNGTGLFTIDYKLENTSVSDSFNLGFIVRVDPDGAGFFTNDTGSSSFASAVAGEPSSWEIDSSGGNIDSNIGGGALDNSNNCLAGCDLIYALQWDLGLLNPGQIALVRVGLSDNGQALSANFLDANSLSDSASLRLSGVASVVPIPAALPLFLSAIAGLGFLSRRKRESGRV